MATVKRPSGPDEGEAAPESSTTPVPQRIHKTRGGAEHPIVDTYYDARTNCVMDVYEKTRSQLARDQNTGQMVMMPNIKTQIHTFCQDNDIQRRELEKRGFTLEPVLDSNGRPQLDAQGQEMFKITQASNMRVHVNTREAVE